MLPEGNASLCAPRGLPRPWLPNPPRPPDRFGPSQRVGPATARRSKESRPFRPGILGYGEEASGPEVLPIPALSWGPGVSWGTRGESQAASGAPVGPLLPPASVEVAFATCSPCHWSDQRPTPIHAGETCVCGPNPPLPRPVPRLSSQPPSMKT